MVARIIPQGFQDLSGGFEQNPFIAVPTTIANLALWLDAADTSTITQSAGAVSQWNDKSGLGRNASEGTAANQPITGTTTINGKNVLDFTQSATAQLRDNGVNGLPALVGGYTTIAIARRSGSVSNIVQGIQGASDRAGMQWSSTTNFSVFSNANSGHNVNTTITADTLLPHFMAVWTDGVDVKGIYDGQSTTGAGQWAAATTTNGTFYGRATVSMYLCEIISYSRPLTTAELAKIRSYAQAKWGTP